MNDIIVALITGSITVGGAYAGYATNILCVSFGLCV